MNINDISKKVAKFSKETVTEIQKMNEIRQLNTKVNAENKQLKRMYRELGQKLYDMYKDSDQLPEGFKEEFHKIEQSYSTIDLLQDQVRKVKGVVLCPSCNMEVAAGERYCSNCGSRMPEIVTIEDTVDDNAVKVEAEVIDVEVVGNVNDMPENGSSETDEDHTGTIESENSETVGADTEEGKENTVLNPETSEEEVNAEASEEDMTEEASEKEMTEEASEEENAAEEGNAAEEEIPEETFEKVSSDGATEQDTEETV